MILVLNTFNISNLFAQNNTNNVKFNKLVHDFGTFDINDGKKSYTFTFKNIGNTPIVIQTVLSSCGCTTPTWTKNPILPGESGQIKVTFLNDQGAYPFEKALSVYINDINKPYVLRIRGIVKDKNYKITDTYPNGIGPLKMKNTKINAGMVSKGIKKEFQIEVFNSSKKSIRVTPVNTSKGLFINVSPAVFPPESSGIIAVTIDSKYSPEWGKNTFSTLFKINEKLYTTQKLEITCTVIDDFSKMTREQITNAPLPIAEKSSIDLGNVKKGTQAVAVFDIKNYGSLNFKIYKAETNEDGISVDFQQITLPEKSSKITVKIDTKKKSGNFNINITLITNAPSRPQMNLSVEGVVN